MNNAEILKQLRKEMADDKHKVVDLVRCADCQHAVISGGDFVPYGSTGANLPLYLEDCNRGHIPVNGEETDMDWFCADGEPRESISADGRWSSLL